MSIFQRLELEVQSVRSVHKGQTPRRHHACRFELCTVAVSVEVFERFDDRSKNPSFPRTNIFREDSCNEVHGMEVEIATNVFVLLRSALKKSHRRKAPQNQSPVASRLYRQDQIRPSD